MKQYKVVQVSSAEAFETSLNELAQAGWKVIASNMAPLPAAAEDDFVYFALLENTPIEAGLKQMMEENAGELDALDALDSLDSVDLSPSAN
ncbi:hypothetical protein ACFS7Z_12600 [Pontibacter toksunensis]|uniref:DUF4177 domain-containing protein n=1 Tax=Pontibacter toksunensis TaxID=1332631 RepID=A0ABW6BVA0_9BACT